MKKKLIFKIVLNISLIISIILAVIEGIDSLKSIHIFGDGSKLVENYFIKRTFTFFLSAFMQIVFLVLLDAMGINFFCGSVIKDIKEHKESTAEIRKQKRIEELEKELAELQSKSDKDNS